ncbi:MAG: hypothetical protein K0S39_4246 [Paenibacillus sp.]|nr:hypothetical protein [Paenibacillus sp.]
MRAPLHETQPEPVRAEEQEGYTDPDLSGLQQIERVGPMKKADSGSMPAPIRYFGYFFFISATLMLIIGIVMQFVK